MMIKRVFRLLSSNAFLNFWSNFLATSASRHSLRLAIADCLHCHTVLSASSPTQAQLLGPGEGGLASLLGLSLGFDFSVSGRFSSDLRANPAILVAPSDDLGCLAGGARFMKFCIGAGAARRLAGRLWVRQMVCGVGLEARFGQAATVFWCLGSSASGK